MPDLDAAVDDEIGDDVLRLIFICLPPRALHRGPGGAHPAAARRSDAPRRSRGPSSPRGHHRAADRAGETDAGARRTSRSRSPAAIRARRTAFVRARGRSTSCSTRATRRPPGDDWMRPALCDDALRLGRILAEPGAEGAGGARPRRADGDPGVAPAARGSARRGEPILLLDQDRARWDQLLIRRGLAALERAESLGGALGPYGLQAAIAACHARAGPRRRPTGRASWRSTTRLPSSRPRRSWS